MAVGTMTAIGIGAALGAAKYAGDKTAADDQRKRNQAITRFSPWTGLQAGAVKSPSLVGDLGQGAAFGGMMGQGFGAAGPGEVTGAAGGPGAYTPSLTGPATGGATQSLMGAGTAASTPTLEMASEGGSAGALTPMAQSLAGNDSPWMRQAQMQKMYPGTKFGGFNNAFNIAGS